MLSEANTDPFAFDPKTESHRLREGPNAIPNWRDQLNWNGKIVWFLGNSTRRPFLLVVAFDNGERYFAHPAHCAVVGEDDDGECWRPQCP